LAGRGIAGNLSQPSLGEQSELGCTGGSVLHQPSRNGDFPHDLLAGQQLLHPPIRIRQHQQRVGGDIGVGDDLVSDPPVQLNDIFSLIVTGEPRIF
jgi:hypothetical protein